MCRLEDLTALIAVNAGPVLSEDVRDVADRAAIESLVSDVAAAGPPEPVRTRSMWGRMTGSEDEPPQTSARGEQLDKRLGDPLRAILWRRGLLAATVAHAGVGAAQLEDQIGKEAE